MLPRLAIACVALAIPLALFAVAQLLFSGERLRRTLYGLLPLVWGLLLARHLPIGMGEAGALLPVSLSPLGIPWQDALPLWRADSHVIGFCQTLVVVLGLAMSVVLLRRQLATHRSAWLGASGLALVLAAAGRWLVAV